MPPVPAPDPAARPDWRGLPPELRAAVERRLGSPVRHVRSAVDGFTSGFAGVLETAAGERAFVKAAATAGQPRYVHWYAREAAITAALPPGVPAPRPRWTVATGGYAALCLDAVDGRSPARPWAPDELAAVLAAYADVAAALAGSPATLTSVGLPRLADLARDDLSWWREIATGREPLPATAPADGLPLADLAALEALLPGYAGSGGLIHGDLRVDNVLVDRSGGVWFCDWTWLCHGPAWFDLASLLIDAYADGLDADGLFAAHPAGWLAPADALDAALAALAGHALVGAADPDPHAGSRLRAQRLRSGRTALAWLARRRGWPDRFGLSRPTW